MVDGNESKWHTAVYPVFWSKRVTVQKQMGCSPYYAATGTHPLLPIDITEATFLQLPPKSLLSTTDLILRHTIDLTKQPEDLTCLHLTVYAAQCKAALQFEKDHMVTIKDFHFKKGALVLIRNTKIKKSLNQKMVIVVARNHGGAYILCELDGTVFHRPLATFQIIPYLTRQSITLPLHALDIDLNRLKEMQESKTLDDKDYGSPLTEEE
ncbi:hypothetical protein C0991_012284 [Blastosporella zonata]|nr:hypothetical protein C0991_012284 [Blastosporella zonata]